MHYQYNIFFYKSLYVLCSPNDTVVLKTGKDLTYHAEMLDMMGLGIDSVMIIHMYDSMVDCDVLSFASYSEVWMFEDN